MLNQISRLSLVREIVNQLVFACPSLSFCYPSPNHASSSSGCFCHRATPFSLLLSRFLLCCAPSLSVSLFLLSVCSLCSGVLGIHCWKTILFSWYKQRRDKATWHLKSIMHITCTHSRGQEHWWFNLSKSHAQRLFCFCYLIWFIFWATIVSEKHMHAHAVGIICYYWRGA